MFKRTLRTEQFKTKKKKKGKEKGRRNLILQIEKNTHCGVVIVLGRKAHKRKQNELETGGWRVGIALIVV